ncbi:hypothetical protein [Lactiplantibacillus plantarum]|uniref:hypothetical protein n=1 Tax=Lactiplantibacillus plantarum TaxID=1590 RepID=UPI002DEAD033|nr:hypothetical protein [Lactiplantibacillus plantarum]
MKDIISFIVWVWNSTWIWKIATLLTSWWAIHQTSKASKRAYKKKTIVEISYAIMTTGTEAVQVSAVNDGNIDVNVTVLGITDKKSKKNAFIPNESDVFKESMLPKKLSTGDLARQALAIRPLLESIQGVMDLTQLYGFAELSTGEKIYSSKAFNLEEFLK